MTEMVANAALNRLASQEELGIASNLKNRFGFNCKDLESLNKIQTVPI